MGINPELLERLRAEGHEAYVIEAGDVSVVVRPPSRASMRRFYSTLAKPERAYEAMEALLLDSLIYPDRAEFSQVLERKPGLVNPLAEKLLDIAGAKEEATFRPL